MTPRHTEILELLAGGRPRSVAQELTHPVSGGADDDPARPDRVGGVGPRCAHARRRVAGASRAGSNSGFARGEAHQAEKRGIARAAAALVRPGMAISLDTGTTTLEIARAVPEFA